MPITPETLDDPPRRRGRRTAAPLRAAILAASACAFTLGAAGCAGARSADGGAAPEASRSSPPPAASRFFFTGELRAISGEEIRTPMTTSWPIQIKWMAPEGSEVAAGERVLEFDNTGILSKLEEQRLAYNDALSRLRSREAQVEGERAEKRFAVERARIELERSRLEAAVPESMRARRDYDSKQLSLEKARAAAASADRNLAAFEVAARDDLEVLRIETAKAERSVTRATESLEQLSMKARRAGVLVYADHPWEGRKFQAGDDTWPRMTVMRIPDLERMEVVGWLSDVDDGAVTPGLSVSCVLDTYPDRTFTGRVRDVSALAEARSRENNLRAFQVRVDLDRGDPRLMRPGMSVRIEIGRESG